MKAATMHSEIIAISIILRLFTNPRLMDSANDDANIGPGFAPPAIPSTKILTMSKKIFIFLFNFIKKPPHPPDGGKRWLEKARGRGRR